jgi:ABC-type nitrate/sulfonate/bicarbonate transport system permease component
MSAALERHCLPRSRRLPSQFWRKHILSTIRQFGPALAGLVSVFIVWQAVVMLTGATPDILPSPIRVFTGAWNYRETLLAHATPTIVESVVGLATTVIAALALAIAGDFFPVFRRFLYPILVVSQTIPIVVIAPLMVIWFGYALLPKIVIIVIVTFFSLTVALTDGFDSTEPEAADLLRSMGATRMQQFLLVRFPAALPSFFTGLRIAVTWSVTAAIFGEYVGAEKGLGIFMQIAKNDFRTDLVLATVLVVSVLSLLLFAIVNLLRRAIIPWHVAMQGRTKR